jgi:hypothetical protein
LFGVVGGGVGEQGLGIELVQMTNTNLSIEYTIMSVYNTTIYFIYI